MTEKYANIQNSSHRLIASRFPTIGVFDDLTSDPDEARVAFLLESMTNPRLSADAAVKLELLSNDEIITGDTASLIMAAFLHGGEGRFNTDKLGAWYASLDLKTAIHETLYHNERRLKMSEGGFPSKIQMRQLISDLDCTLVDIRGMKASLSSIYEADPAKYLKAQIYSDGLRQKDETGIVFDSVRRDEGVNVCIFKPSSVKMPVKQGDHFLYEWNKEGEATVLKLSNVDIST